MTTIDPRTKPRGDIFAQMRQQQMWDQISKIGAALMAAQPQGGPTPAHAEPNWAAAGQVLGQGSQRDPLNDMLKMAKLEQLERQQAQAQSLSDFVQSQFQQPSQGRARAGAGLDAHATGNLAAEGPIMPPTASQGGVMGQGGSIMSPPRTGVDPVMARALLAGGQPVKALEALRGEQMKPPTGFQWGPEGSLVPIPGYIEGRSKIAAAGADKISVEMKDIAEITAKVDAIKKLRASGDPQDAETADRIEMEMTFGGKPPEAYVKATSALGQAREALSSLYRNVQKGVSSITPEDRATLRQDVSDLTLAFADLMNRGANFTDTEQSLIRDTIGGDPTDIVSRLMRGDESYLRAFRKTGEMIERRGRELVGAYTQIPKKDHRFPWQPDIPNMSEDELLTLDPKRLSPADRKRLDKRLKDLGL